MPYGSNAELPKGVKALPEEAQTVFRKAFNAIMKRPGVKEASAFRQAWGAVKNAGWEQNEEGEWEKAEDAADDVPVVRAWDSWDASTVEMHEIIAFDEGARMRKTERGYLVAYPRVARTGIQIYRGDEVGKPQMDEVRVYRPEEEVFAKDAMHSFAHLPITNDHPPKLIDASNWRDYSVGQGGDEVLRDGSFLRVPMVLMDGKAVKDVESGKRQLSGGYTMELRWGKGQTPDGQAFDAVQTSIRGNHIAVVKRARGGPDLTIGDEGDEDMTTPNLKSITVDGLPCEMTEMAANIVAKAMAKHDADLSALTQKFATETAAKDAALKAADELKKTVETKDAEIAALKKKVEDAALTPDKIDALVKDRALAIGKAKAVLGDRLVVDNKSIEDIKRQVVDAKLGDAAKGYNADQVAAAFDAFTSGVKVDDRSSNPGGRPNPLDDSLRRVHTNQLTPDKAWDGMVTDLENAWRRPEQKASA